MRGLRRAVVLAVLLALAACGSSDRGVSQPAGRQLRVRVEAIRTAARGMDRSAASQQLASLRSSVTRLRATKALSQDAAARIRRAADAVEDELIRIPLPPTTTTTTTLAPKEERRRGNRGPGHEKQEKRGKHDSED